MPTIAKQHIRVTGNDGDVYTVSLVCSVNASGQFRLVIPTELEEEAFRSPPNGSAFGCRKIRVVGRSGGSAVVECAQLSDGLAFLRQTAKTHIEVETVVERVIGVSYVTCAAFYIGRDGSVHPNGAGVKDGAWWRPCGPGGVSPVNLSPERRFSVGFAAQVFDRTTFRRASGDRTQWALVADGDPETRRLNSFCGVDVIKERGSPVIVIPYTPESARRLADLMLGLCRMAGQVDAFFGVAEELAGKLDKAGPPLLEDAP